MKNKKGFTLIELLSTIAILAIVLGIASTAYIGISKYLKKSYYKTLEESILVSGGEYYAYTRDRPEMFGDEKRVPLEDLVKNKYLTDITDRKGNQCDLTLDKSYVGAYKDSYDKTNYYVCLTCSKDDYQPDKPECLGNIGYSLQATATINDTNKVYQPNTWVNQYVKLTFKTLNDVEMVYIKDRTTGTSFDCRMEGTGTKTCSKKIDISGNYEYYGVSPNGQKTKSGYIEILVDTTAPTFEVYEGTEKITSDKIFKDITPEIVTINNLVKDIVDTDSKIQSIKYSFERKGDTEKYITVDNNLTEFNVTKNLGLGEYVLVIEVADYAGNINIRRITYQRIKEVNKADSSYCNNLTYNESVQTLTKTPGEGYTFSGNTGKNAGNYTVTASLASGYKWSDDTTEDKTFICTISKATPTITLSSTSGTVAAGDSLTFTEKANIAGKFTNSSGTTSVATVSPTSSSTAISANTNQTVTITGVAAGSSTITVNFTPTDTTNYNNATAKTYTATVTAKATIPTASNYCKSLTYTGSYQTLTKTAGTGYTFSGNTGKNAGNYTVTATLASGYKWSDNTTGNKTFTCTISKATPTITLSSTSGSLYVGSTTTFTEKANVAGKFTNSSGTTSVATVSPTSNSTAISANTNQTVTITGVAVGSSTITVNFTPTDTTNYNNATAKTYTATVTAKATIPTASSYCKSLTYTGSYQTLTKTAGTGYTFSGNMGKNAGSYTVTATLASGYKWSDNTTGNKTFTCRISKATPTITLSSTSGSLYVGSTTTFTEKANVAGKFTNSSGSTSVATVSPTSNSTVISANTTQTVTITGKATGSSTITVNFTPTDTTNYNSAIAKTYTANVSSATTSTTIPTASSYCKSLTYTGSSQTLTKTAGTGYTFSGNTGTNAGSYTVTATLSSGYKWSDNTTGNKTFICTISKATPTITLSSTSGSLYVGSTTTFTEKANVAGKFTNSSGTTSVATVSPTSNSTAISANTNQTVTITGVAVGSSTITVNFTPTDTTNYNNATAKTYNATVSLVGYTVRHYQMNNDGTNYTLVSTITGTGKVGSSITGTVNAYDNFSSPSSKTITLTATPSNNVINYYYTRNCYGTTCDYCKVGSGLGYCLYSNASKVGLKSSGGSNDTSNSNLRFIGSSSSTTSNYICFGNNTSCTTSNGTLYRIIGVFGSSHETRIISTKMYGPNYFHGSTNLASPKFNYKYAALYTTVNNTASSILSSSTGLSTGTWTNIVASRNVRSGYNVSPTETADSLYNILEKDSSHDSCLTNNVFPITLSDLLLSNASASATYKNNYSSVASSWLFSGTTEWGFVLYNSARAFAISTSGRICSGANDDDSNCDTSGYFSTSDSTNSNGDYKYRHYYRLNFQLNTSALFCGGSGTSSDPYKVGYNAC